MQMSRIKKRPFTAFEDQTQVALILDEMRARHVGGYAALLKVIVTQIAEYFSSQKTTIGNKEGSEVKFIIGLSGGIDSSVVTYLSVHAVGAINVVPITMPARDNDTESIYKSELVRSYLGINNAEMQYIIPIGEIVKKQIEAINSLSSDVIKINTHSDSQSIDDKIRIGNFASRTRIAILYDISKKLNGRVLGTGSKTEFLQGYCAKYGTPFSFDYGVLDDLYKVDIIELARLLDVHEAVIHSVPTTGYYSGQTHEEELGLSLEEQDVLAYLLFEKKLNTDSIVNKYRAHRQCVELMAKRYTNSTHKRMLRQLHVSLTDCNSYL